MKREVAIKVLPGALAADPDRLARFQREAEVLASLNHPNIAHVHGLEEADGVKALVMELRARGAAVEVDAVRALFDVRLRPGSLYAVSADGKRFLVNSLSEQTAQPPMTVVVNWPAAVRK